MQLFARQASPTDCLRLDWSKTHSLSQKGKKLQFLKSEIDAWLIGDKHKSVAELQADAAAFVANKKGGLK